MDDESGIFAEPPPSLRLGPDAVSRLKQMLHGLREAARPWQQHLTLLMKMGGVRDKWS